MLGAAMLVIPLVVPHTAAAYLFGLVWLGFIFLLEPLNARLGATSLVNELAQGRRGRLYALLVSGAVCGIFWEFWNYWATGKWIYVFPIFQNLKIFEMPLPGYLGFPPLCCGIFLRVRFRCGGCAANWPGSKAEICRRVLMRGTSATARPRAEPAAYPGAWRWVVAVNQVVR